MQTLREPLHTADATEQESVATMHESLATLVRLLERVAPGMRGSILLLDDDGVTLRHGTAPNLPDDYSRAIDGSKIGPAAGSCGTAAYRGERVIVRDIATDPLWADYRQLAEPHGLAACWSTPIFDGDKVLGTFAMYYEEPRDPAASDIALTDIAATLARNVIKRWRGAAELRARTDAAEGLASELRQSEERFRTMAATIPVQVWTARSDGMLDYVTDRTAEYFGVPAEELLGEGWTGVVHPDDLENAGKRWRHSIETGEPYEVQFRVRSRDGEYRWQLVRAQAVRSDDGGIVQWFGCNSDIEESKRLEAALDTALTSAIQANKAKADFLAMMSHELRTPLNAIGGYTQLMLEGIPAPASDAHKDYLRRISMSQGHLLGLIDAVLTQSKLEAGKVTYRIADTKIGEVLDEVESLTAPQRAAKRLVYDCDSCDRDLTFRADREKLVQILLNVLSNAAKFTPSDGRITVRTEVTASRAGAISISDTGVGMSAAELAVVFEPYVQFDSALSREHKGTGLGMPISRELARGMGGDLTATSEPGAGSTFSVSLPLADSARP